MGATTRDIVTIFGEPAGGTRGYRTRFARTGDPNGNGLPITRRPFVQPLDHPVKRSL